MRIIECQQGTQAWFSARCGIPTASNFDCIITTKGEPSKQMKKYLYQVAGERITGIAEETYQNAAMLRGQEVEDEARKFYEFSTGQEVKEVGFCLADGYGASPDGLVGKEGLLEIKCPLISTHVSYLLENKLPSEYFIQTQGQLLVTGKKWVDFISYYGGMKPLIVRTFRDEKFIKSLRVELELFVNELKEVINKIK